jgi:hypothetical protein
MRWSAQAVLGPVTGVSLNMKELLSLCSAGQVLLIYSLVAVGAAARRCHSNDGIDVCIAMCASTMTGSVGLENEKSFALKIYDSFDAKSTRIVTYAYSTEAKVVAELSSNFRAGKEAVRKYSGQDGAPRAVNALAQCNATLAPSAKRHRIVLLFVHGPDSFVGPIQETADSMKKNSTYIACIALRNKSASAGGLPDVDNMAQVASEASKYGRKMVYFVDIHDALDNDAVDTVQRQTCSVVGELSPVLSGGAIAAIVLALIVAAMAASCVLSCKFARSRF